MVNTLGLTLSKSGIVLQHLVSLTIKWQVRQEKEDSAPS